MPYTPSIAELIALGIAADRQSLFVGLPAKVLARNVAANTVDLEVQVRIPVPADDDSTVNETMPVIPAVPVAFFGAGPFAITMPVEPGATGSILVMTYSISQWLESGKVSDAGDVRHGHVSNAVFFPGLCPKAAVPAQAATNALVLEGPSIMLGAGASQFVPLANLVKAELDKIQATLATGVANLGTGAVTFGTPYTASPVAATKVKAE